LRKRATDLIFDVGLAIKGIDAMFEVIGGILLTMPVRLARYILVLSQHELYRHHEVLSGRLDRLAATVTVHAHLYAALYLIVHGGAKVILILAIVKGKRWGYVGLMAVLSAFVLFEAVRALSALEVLTGALALFDVLVVIVIWKEYKTKFVGL